MEATNNLSVFCPGGCCRDLLELDDCRVTVGEDGRPICVECLELNEEDA